MAIPLCIYHGGCDDGFAAAWCVRKALGDGNVEFYPGVYQKDPPLARKFGGGGHKNAAGFSVASPVHERV